jgi:cytosine/adenosine deaminase-related metal-dependent hydrolase
VTAPQDSLHGDPPGRVLRARRVVPVSGPPIEDGAVEIRGGRVMRVRRWSDGGASGWPVEDLGEVILLPGLVNAHCHLDYTGLVGCIAPTRSFADWIKSILAAKSAWTDDEFAASWREGARQLVATGTTTVANIETLPHLVAGLRSQTPLRVHSFIELTGVRSRREPSEMVEEAMAWVSAWQAGGGRGGAGVSPHAPYSTLPGLLGAVAVAASRAGCRMTMHVAESREEFEMFMYRRGAMHEWLHVQRPDDDCGLGSPVQHVARHGLLGPGFLAVHVNYLWDGDARLLGESGSAVVHCPRSHAYFRHQRFPAAELADAGVRACLGTDSLASTRAGMGAGMGAAAPGPAPVLSMFDEMAAYLAHDATVSPAEVLEMATVRGAHALGLRDGTGCIVEGGPADLCAIPDGGPGSDVHEVIAGHVGDVHGTWIAGVREASGA